MTCLYRIIFLLFFIFTVSGIAAQQTNESIDDVYGSDPLLFNGKYYTFYPPLNTGGTQYLIDRQFELGTAKLRGVTYSNLNLNYDIYNQQLILKYISNTGANNMIIISDAWLESFSFKGMNFELIPTQDTLKRIFQVIGTGADRICYSWRKELDLDNFYGAKNHVFSVPRKEMSVISGTNFTKFWNNKSFCALFDPEKKVAVKGYLRKNSIKVRKADDQKMAELINYCNTF
jgi:hypothetical protein